MLEHPSDRCSCSAQVVRAHLAPPGRTVIDSRHRCEVRTRPSILGPMRPIVEFWGSRAWQWPNALAPFLNGDAPSRVAVAYTSGHCINVSQYLTRSTSPRGVPTEFCMLAVRLAVDNAAPCDKDASGEVARSQCVLNCPSSPLRQSRVSPRSVWTLRWPVAVYAGTAQGRSEAGKVHEHVSNALTLRPHVLRSHLKAAAIAATACQGQQESARVACRSCRSC